MMNAKDHISYPADGHDACLMVEDESFWFVHRNQCISSLVSRFLPRGRLADIGGGNGFVAQRLQDDGLNVVLVEPGSDGARNAREIRRIGSVIEGSLSSARAQLGAIDAIGAFDVVEHIEDDTRFIDDVADTLCAGGLFFSTVPAHKWLWSHADIEAGHYRRYSRRSYGALLGDRFEVLFSSYFFGALTLPIALRRALPYRLGMPRRSGNEIAAREHATSGGIGAKLLSLALSGEAQRISSLQPISVGSSLIVAARKREYKN